MAEPIEIVIRKTQETAHQTSTTTSVGGAKNKGKTSATQKAINTALINAGKQIASTAINQYGNLTGNTLVNRQINSVTQVAGYIGQIAVGGWVGAIAVAAQVGVQGLGDYAQRQRANQEAQMLYSRSGNVTINGGRGTND